MSRRSCDGAGLLAAFRAAVANLERHVDEINGLNVYPVPDGDTGANMLATVQAALEEAERADPVTAERIAAAISMGALMGARGNSGVITSQVFRGMAEALGGKRRFNGLDLAHSLREGTRTAYGAVARPVEGTILTVVREAAEAAVAAAEDDPDLETVLGASVEAAERAVAKTPSLLAILREAGVVDAGGQGLFRLFQGALQHLRGEAATRARPAHEPGRPAAIPAADEVFGYETMFLLEAPAGAPLDVDAIRAHLKSVGDSVLVAGDPRAVKVHVHTDRPDGVIAYGLGLGALSRISVENLDHQARDVREARAAGFAGPATGLAGSATGRTGSATESHARPPSAGGTVRAGSVGHTETKPARHRTTAPEDAAGTVASVEERPPAPPTDPTNGATPRAARGVVEAIVDATRPFGGTGPAVVAVVAGEGLARIYQEFGVDQLIQGGQSANPSTGELLRVARLARAREVLLLPNNPNVRLAAEQAAALCTEKRIVVVPTRNAAEGLAALLRIDPTKDAAANEAPMTAAGRAIQTLQVTEAVRDASIDGRKVKKGQTIVLDPDEGLVAASSDRERAILAGVATFRPETELVTVYYGDGADLDEAEATGHAIGQALPGAEVEVVHGGQPHYRYLLSAE